MSKFDVIGEDILYKAAIKKADGTIIELYAKEENHIIEIASITVFSMKWHYTGARLFSETRTTIKLIGRILEDGKYVKE